MHFGQTGKQRGPRVSGVSHSPDDIEDADGPVPKLPGRWLTEEQLAV
jgi:hypothetical protein